MAQSIPNDRIYDLIHVILKNQYPDEPEKTDCMLKDFKQNKFADKFYTPDRLPDEEKLAREIKPFIDEINIKCTLIQFFKSTLGISVIIGVLIIVICGIGCLMWNHL